MDLLFVQIFFPETGYERIFTIFTHLSLYVIMTILGAKVSDCADSDAGPGGFRPYNITQDQDTA